MGCCRWRPTTSADRVDQAVEPAATRLAELTVERRDVRTVRTVMLAAAPGRFTTRLRYTPDKEYALECRFEGEADIRAPLDSRRLPRGGLHRWTARPSRPNGTANAWP